MLLDHEEVPKLANTAIHAVVGIISIEIAALIATRMGRVRFHQPTSGMAKRTATGASSVTVSDVLKSSQERRSLCFPCVTHGKSRCCGSRCCVVDVLVCHVAANVASVAAVVLNQKTCGRMKS